MAAPSIALIHSASGMISINNSATAASTASTASSNVVSFQTSNTFKTTPTNTIGIAPSAGAMTAAADEPARVVSDLKPLKETLTTLASFLRTAQNERDSKCIQRAREVCEAWVVSALMPRVVAAREVGCWRIDVHDVACPEFANGGKCDLCNQANEPVIVATSTSSPTTTDTADTADTADIKASSTDVLPDYKTKAMRPLQVFELRAVMEIIQQIMPSGWTARSLDPFHMQILVHPQPGNIVPCYPVATTASSVPVRINPVHLVPLPILWVSPDGQQVGIRWPWNRDQTLRFDHRSGIAWPPLMLHTACDKPPVVSLPLSTACDELLVLPSHRLCQHTNAEPSVMQVAMPAAVPELMRGHPMQIMTPQEAQYHPQVLFASIYGACVKQAGNECDWSRTDLTYTKCLTALLRAYLVRRAFLVKDRSNICSPAIVTGVKELEKVDMHSVVLDVSFPGFATAHDQSVNMTSARWMCAVPFDHRELGQFVFTFVDKIDSVKHAKSSLAEKVIVLSYTPMKELVVRTQTTATVLHFTPTSIQFSHTGAADHMHVPVILDTVGMSFLCVLPAFYRYRAPVV